MITYIAEGSSANQGSDAEYETHLREASAGQPILNAVAITAIIATLKDAQTGAVINSRTAQNVKDLNGGTLVQDATGGLFTLKLSGATDMIISTPAPAGTKEEHVLTLLVTYNRTGGGTGTVQHQVRFSVVNLTNTP